jgi:ABC-type oligopeptide transport system substrate-binding subunit
VFVPRYASTPNEYLKATRAEVTSGSVQIEKMAEVAGLAAAIADRILEQNEAGTSIPPEQFRMLVRAARMLLDSDVPWPPSVAYVVLEVARRVEEAQPVSRGDDVVVHLKQGPNVTKRA